MKIEETEAYIQETAKLKARGDAFNRVVVKCVKLVLTMGVTAAVLVGGIMIYTQHQSTFAHKKWVAQEQFELKNQLTQEDTKNPYSMKRFYAADGRFIRLHPLNSETLIIETQDGKLSLFENLGDQASAGEAIMASKGSDVIGQIKFGFKTLPISGHSLFYIDVDEVRFKKKLRSASEIQKMQQWRDATPEKRETLRQEYNEMADELGSPHL